MRSFTVFLICLLIQVPVRLCAQCINTYPYTQDFEVDNGSWTPSGTNSDWSWGSPAKGVINTAGSGNNCWISGGLSASAYTGSQKSWIESPCFDFSTLENPYLSFLIFWDTEKQYDGGNLQYSLNNGTSWSNLGTNSQIQDCLEKNWFNSSNITNLSGLASPQQGWSGTVQATSGSCLGGNGSGSWKEASICLMALAGEPSVQFRFTFCSGTTCNAFDGIAIDLFKINEAPIPQPAIQISCNTNYSISLLGTSTYCPQQWKWDMGDLTTLADTSVQQNANYTYPGPGEYTVTLEADHYCTAKGITTAIVKFPALSVTTDSVNCSGGTDGAATASVNGVNNPVYTWGTDPVTQGNSVNNLSVGNYTLLITSDDGCDIDTVVGIVYGPEADVSVSLGPTQYICNGESILLYPGSYSNYLWQDGSTDSSFLASDPGTYHVLVTTASGCKDSASADIIFSCGDYVWIPNAFTPGSDGLNDYFKPVSSTFEEGRLQIFNRWGQPVFTGDFEKGWDGNYNGQPAPEGVYYYRFRYRLPGDKYREKAGWMTLLR